MKVATGLFVLFALACSPKKKESAVVKSVPMGSLLGSWVNCESYTQGAIVGVKSSAIVYTFRDAETLVMAADYYTDENCQTVFGKAEAEAYLKEFVALSGQAVPADVRDAVMELTQGMREEVPYRATLVPLGEIGALDLMSLRKPSFTSYRILGDSLYIAHVCQEEDCEKTGEGPVNRALDLSLSDRFKRR